MKYKTVEWLKTIAKGARLDADVGYVDDGNGNMVPAISLRGMLDWSRILVYPATATIVDEEIDCVVTTTASGYSGYYQEMTIERGLVVEDKADELFTGSMPSVAAYQILKKLIAFETSYRISKVIDDQWDIDAVQKTEEVPA